MKESIVNILKNVGFAEMYISICNTYPYYNDGKNFKKGDILNILEKLDANLDYASREKVFYKDYSVGSTNIRFSFTYKYGFIECFYVISSTETDERVRGRFNTIATLEKQNFKEQVKHNFPVATSIDDLTSILANLLELNNKFIEEVRNQQNRNIIPIN